MNSIFLTSGNHVMGVDLFKINNSFNNIKYFNKFFSFFNF